ncbi:fam-b protein [Plasmodium chabaudi adami]|uniref:Fam-b protein n=1 Tax=Plasmodium chabaudi adami TaxID=5826 RepID=A0A1C6WMZ7_PLACE|nr:fam-b protein [Plasmodium chabaudi adami]
MRVSILKFVFLLIIICFFEYTKKELYFISETTKCLERNIINFRNNRILAYLDDQFDLNDFYESPLNIVDQFIDYIGDDKEMTNLRYDIATRIKPHIKNNKLPNLNNLDRKTKKLIYKLQKRLKQAKKEFYNKKNAELAIHPKQDKRIIKNYENTLETEDNHFEDVYNKITSNDGYKKFKINKNYKKSNNNLFMERARCIVRCLLIVTTMAFSMVIIFMPVLLI